MTDAVLLESSDRVATLRLNRGPRNTMTPETMSAFSSRISEIRQSPDIRCLVITSNGKHFCAGAELSAGMPGEAQALGGVPGTADRLRSLYEPFLSLIDLPIPTVAAINGAAVGGGLGLALSCDFRVVSPESRMMAPFPRLGIHPGMALTSLLPTLVGLPRAMEMLMTGCEIRGEQALSWGLANRCVDQDEMVTEAQTLARTLSEGAPAVVRWTKRAVHRAIGLDIRSAADMEAFAQAITFQSDDCKEGMNAFFDKRKPEFSGS